MPRLLVASLAIVLVVPAFAEERTVKPVLVLSGTDSKVTKPDHQLIRSAEELAKIWEAHAGTEKDAPKVPEVDFENYMVVAFFKGETYSPRIHVVGIVEKSGETRIRTRSEGVQLVLGYTGPTYRTYAFVVIHRANVDIVLDLDDSNRRPSDPDYAPVWKEYGRYKAKKDK